MANLFINLPIPGSNGSGAAVDVSGLGSLKTFVVGSTAGANGEPFRCTLNIEMSNAAVAPVVDDEWAPVLTFDQAGDQTVAVAAKWMRIRRSDSKTPTGTPTCDVGSNGETASLVTFAVTAGDGSGASVDTSALPVYKTVTVGSAFRGNVVVEISNDNVHFSPQFSMTNGGQMSAEFTANWMRVSRDGVPTISPGLPVVDIAATNGPGAGGGGGGLTGEQFFTVAGVLNQSSYAVTLPTARTDASYQVIPTVSVPSGNNEKVISVDPTSITNTGFTAELTAGAQTGDVLVFHVADV